MCARIFEIVLQPRAAFFPHCGLLTHTLYELQQQIHLPTNRGGTVKECLSAPPVSWPSYEAPLQYKMNRLGHTRSLLWPGPDISRKTGKPLRPGMTRRKEYLGAGVLKIPHKEMNNREKAQDAPFLTSHPTCFHRRTALTFQEGSAQVSDSPKDH